MSPRTLPVISPEAVTSGEDMLQCPKLHAKVSAAFCSGLFAAKDKPIPAPRGRKSVEARREKNAGQICQGCPIGPVVVARLVAPGAPPPCA